MHLILFLCVSSELPSNIGAEVDCLKGTTPKTTAPSEEKTTDAAVQTEQNEGYVSLTLFSVSHFRWTSLNGSKVDQVQNKRIMPFEKALLLTVALARYKVEKK